MHSVGRTAAGHPKGRSEAQEPRSGLDSADARPTPREPPHLPTITEHRGKSAYPSRDIIREIGDQTICETTTAWAALAPLHPYRSFVPPVSIAPCSGGALPLSGSRRVASRRISKTGSFGTTEVSRQPIRSSRAPSSEPEAAVRRAGEAPAEAVDAAPTVASSRVGTLTVFPVSPATKTSVPEVAVWSSPAVRARLVHRHLHRCRAVEVHREAEVFVPSLSRP